VAFKSISDFSETNPFLFCNDKSEEAIMANLPLSGKSFGLRQLVGWAIDKVEKDKKPRMYGKK
jgi:hypothetical protein